MVGEAVEVLAGVLVEAVEVLAVVEAVEAVEAVGVLVQKVT